ncbi:MAG: ABC transporter permease [Ruminococcaceae bacterium]|nr:ABC transporter permease [Oscillospiraceae bacterium]
MIQRLTNPFKELIRYKDLLIQLVSRDLKLKYRRSFLGYLWSILSPLLIMSVQALVFSHLFRRGFENDTVSYPVYLLSGQILFNYMNQSTHMAIHSILDSRELIKKVYLPKYIFTISKITSGLIDLVFSMGALVVVMLVFRVKFSLHFLLFPFVLIQLYFFCLGLGLFLAQANVFFRDIQYIYTVVTTAWLYLTPIFYKETMLPEKLQIVVKYCNPMLFYISQFRAVVLYNTFPGWKMVLAGCGAAVAMMLIGSYFFARKQNDFILYI